MIKTHVATLKRRTTKETEYGNDIVVYVDSGRISGILDYLKVAKGEIADKVVEDSSHLFISKTKVKIRQGDRLVVNEVEYEVNHVDRPLMGLQAEIELKPVLVQNNDVESLIYFGFNNESELIESDILTLDSQSFKQKSFTKSLDATAKNLVIAYPKTYGKASIRINNKPITDTVITEIMVNGTTYLVYRKTDVSGKLHIELF